MSNINSPNGFRPVRHLSGGTLRLNEYRIASGTPANIFTGDIVDMVDTGYITPAAAGDVNLIGVFAGVRWTDPDGTPRWEKRWPSGQTTLGGADAYALVYDDPDTVFEAQVTGGAFAQTHVGNNADIVATAGDVVNGQSRFSINLASPGAATAQIRILGLIDRPEVVFGANARVECYINEHLFRATAGI